MYTNYGSATVHTITVKECQMINNTASDNGGAIHNMYIPRHGIGVNLLVILCLFINNTASGSGGAIFKTGNS